MELAKCKTNIETSQTIHIEKMVKKIVIHLHLIASSEDTNVNNQDSDFNTQVNKSPDSQKKRVLRRKFRKNFLQSFLAVTGKVLCR